MLSRKKNKKRNKSKRKNKKNSFFIGVKTSIIAIILGGLCAFGTFKYWGHRDGEILDPIVKKTGNLKKQKLKTETFAKDLTLVNEIELLKDSILQSETLKKFKPDLKDKIQAEEPDSKHLELDDKALSANENKFPLFAVAYHFHTQVFNAPSKDARVVGYARRGATFKASEKINSTGCVKGWYEINPGGVFACSGKGIIVSDEEVTFTPSPPPADIDSSLPYKYMYTTEKNVAQYWKIPSDEEIDETSLLFEKMELSDNTDSDNPIAIKLDAGFEGDAGNNPFQFPSYLYQKMDRHFFVSVDQNYKRDDFTFIKTVRGRFIESKYLIEIKKHKFEGLLIDETHPLPQVFVKRGGVHLVSLDGNKNKLTKFGKAIRLDNFPFISKMTYKKKKYIQTGDNIYIRSHVVSVAKAIKPPDNLKPFERWIHIDLKEQTLVAYEGEHPVFATLISTGKDGFDTPYGEFSIYSKHVSITMDDTAAGDESYSIEDVPWTQYFEEGYALHAAFWHNRFGHVRSHGCINLSPRDAQRLFFWTGPHLAHGLHGLVSTKNNPGTRIIITK